MITLARQGKPSRAKQGRPGPALTLQLTDSPEISSSLATKGTPPTTRYSKELIMRSAIADIRDPGALSGPLAGASFIGGVAGAMALADSPYPRPGSEPAEVPGTSEETPSRPGSACSANWSRRPRWPGSACRW